MKFRRRPETIEAIQFVELERIPGKYADHVRYNVNEVAEFADALSVLEVWFPESPDAGRLVLVLKFAEDKNVSISVQSWLVRDSAGRFSVCSPLQFADLFEPV